MTGIDWLLWKRTEGVLSATPGLVHNMTLLNKPSKQTCDRDIMNGWHKASPGISEWRVFFAGAPGWIGLCDLGKGTHSSPEGTAFPVHFPHCLRHHVLLSPLTGALATSQKNAFDRKFPQNPAESEWHKHKDINGLTRGSYFQTLGVKLLQDNLLSLTNSMSNVISYELFVLLTKPMITIRSALLIPEGKWVEYKQNVTLRTAKTR